MKKAAIAATMLFSLMAASLAGAEKVTLFAEPGGGPGKVHPLAAEDKGLHPDDGFFYMESWFMIAISETGHYGYVTFIVSNSGVEPKTPGVSFTIVTPERERLVRDVDYKPEDLKLKADPFSIVLKDTSFKETAKGYKLEVMDDGLGMELEFENEVPGFVLGDGKAVFGDNVFYINYPGPRPTFSGKFLIGGKEVPVKGWGYIDHSVTTSNPADYQEVWHNFKFRGEERTVLISSFTTPEAYDKDFSFGVVTDGGEVLCSFTEVEVTESNISKEEEESGKPYPGKVSYAATGEGCEVNVAMDVSSPDEKFDVLAKLDKKWWGRAAKLAINTFIAEPWYFRAVGDVEVEITLDGKTEKVPGKAFNEVIFSQ